MHCTSQWVVSLGKREAQEACAANVRVHKMHKCIQEGGQGLSLALSKCEQPLELVCRTV